MNTRIAPRRAALWAAVLGWAGLIFAMSSIPGSNMPGRLGPLAHFVEYAVLAALLCLALAMDHPLRFSAIAAVALASAYAITDEYHQSFVPMRTPDPIDWVVDSAGALLGVAAIVVFYRLTADRRR